MKFFSIVFLTYILVFSFIPHTYIEQIIDKGVYQSSTDKEQNNQDTDHCLPFCLCTCCAQICSYLQVTFDFKISLNADSQLFTFYNFSIISKVDLSFWQPPKYS